MGLFDTCCCWKGPSLPTWATQPAYLPCKGSGTHCIPPRPGLNRQQSHDRGSLLPKENNAASTFFGSSFPVPAHMVLLLLHLQLCHSSGPSRDNSISSKWHIFAMLWHREHAGLAAKIFLFAYSVPVSTGGVFCNLHQIQQNSKERLTGSIITGDAGNRILTGKCQTQHSSPICHCAKSNAVENRLRQGLQMKVAF